MLSAALRDGTAHRRTHVRGVRPPAARRPPLRRGRRAPAGFWKRCRSSGSTTTRWHRWRTSWTADTLAYLRDFRFGGDVDGYAEGELYFPARRCLSVRGTFAECVILETLALSIFNHDTAIASAAARMVSAAEGRTLIEMGSRRTHERAAVAAARAAYLAGFDGSSNLEAQRRYGVPPLGTSAHAFTLLHTTADGPDEPAAFRAQVAALGVGTTLLVDTYDVTTGVANAVAAAGPELGAVRIDSGDLGVLARQVREQLDRLGATGTRIVVSGDLDEFAIAGAARRPGRQLRRRHVVGHRLRRADREHGLQAGRGRRHAGGETQQPQGIPRRPQGGTAAGHVDGTIIEEIVYPAGRPPSAAEPSRT